MNYIWDPGDNSGLGTFFVGCFFLDSRYDIQIRNVLHRNFFFSCTVLSNSRMLLTEVPKCTSCLSQSSGFTQVSILTLLTIRAEYKIITFPNPVILGCLLKLVSRINIPTSWRMHGNCFNSAFGNHSAHFSFIITKGRINWKILSFY